MRSRRENENAAANLPEANEEQQTEELASRSERLKQNKKQEKTKAARRKHAIAVIVSIVVVVVGVYFLLWLVAKLALYESIPAMLQDMYATLQVMMQRLVS